MENVPYYALLKHVPHAMPLRVVQCRQQAAGSAQAAPAAAATPAALGRGGGVGAAAAAAPAAAGRGGGAAPPGRGQQRKPSQPARCDTSHAPQNQSMHSLHSDVQCCVSCCKLQYIRTVTPSCALQPFDNLCVPASTGLQALDPTSQTWGAGISEIMRCAQEADQAIRPLGWSGLTTSQPVGLQPHQPVPSSLQQPSPADAGYASDSSDEVGVWRKRAPPPAGSRRTCASEDSD